MSTLLAGIAIGGLTGGSLLLAEVISGQSTITLREAVGVGVFTCGVIWWLGRKFQSIEDDLRRFKDDMTKIKKRLDCNEDDDD